jgi:hypothetical protein
MKRVQSTTDPELRRAFGQVSKAALFDLVVDLLRQQEGDEHLDGPSLLVALGLAYEPVRAQRRDPPLRWSGGGSVEPITRTAILDLVDRLTRCDTGWGQLVDLSVLDGRLRSLGCSEEVTHNHLKVLCATNMLEVVHDRDGIAYRLSLPEYTRRHAPVTP